MGREKDWKMPREGIKRTGGCHPGGKKEEKKIVENRVNISSESRHCF